MLKINDECEVGECSCQCVSRAWLSSTNRKGVVKLSTGLLMQTPELNGSLQTDTLKTWLGVQDYYGKVLQRSDNLKTSACTAASRPPPRLRNILGKVPQEVIEKFYGCGAPLPEGLSATLSRYRPGHATKPLTPDGPCCRHRRLASFGPWQWKWQRLLCSSSTCW